MVAAAAPPRSLNLEQSDPLVAGDEATGAPRRPRASLLLFLVAVCLLPRVYLAWQRETICADAVTYLQKGDALWRGDLTTAFYVLSLNAYVPIVALLEHAGLEPTVAAKWWSVAMATLAILPLFGWLRRLFDDRIAVLACLLYAFHPGFLLVSPWIVRDPTFWFLFCLTLYLLWRAIVEARWLLYLAAGICLTLSVHTRIEGWLLLIPLFLWTLFRLPHARDCRARLVAGAVVCLALIPLAVAAVNVTLLRGHPRWELGRLSFIAVLWGGHDFTAADTPVHLGDSAVSRRTAGNPNDPSSLKTAERLIALIARNYSYLYGVLLLVGLWRWWRVFLLRRDQVPVFLMNVVWLAAIAIGYWRGGTDARRYILPIVLLSLPCVVMGLFQVGEWVARLAPRRDPAAPGRRRLVVAGMLIVLGAAGLVEAGLFHSIHEAQVVLGRWIVDHVGPHTKIAGSIKNLRLVSYYARGRQVQYPGYREYADAPMLEIVQTVRPDVVLLWNDWKNRAGLDAYRDLLQQHEELGYRRVPQEHLPPSCREIIVLVKTQKPPRADGRPSGAPIARRLRDASAAGPAATR